MNTKSMSLDYIKRASRCLKESKDAFQENDFPITIRRAQECVELSLKAILRSTAIEYPRAHDVGESLEFVKEKFPLWFSSKIPDFKRISRDLSKKRGPALYGYEAQLVPASDIFSRNDAEEALNSADEVFNECSRLVKEIFDDSGHL